MGEDGLSSVRLPPIADIRAHAHYGDAMKVIPPNVGGLLRLTPFALGLIALSSCDAGPCDTSQMKKLINEQIRESSRSPSEFLMLPPEPDGDLVHVAMATKASPSHRRRYWIEPKECRIADLRIDQ